MPDELMYGIQNKGDNKLEGLCQSHTTFTWDSTVNLVCLVSRSQDMGLKENLCRLKKSV